jgi:thiosulfate reductase cytochrome b subunit
MLRPRLLTRPLLLGALPWLTLLLCTVARAEPVGNAVCQECHAVPDLRFVDRSTGESILYSIDPEAYAASAHGAADCVACHESGYGDKLPHEGPPTTPRWICVDCHEARHDVDELDLPRRKQELRDGVHGAEGRMSCDDCHDPHRFATVGDQEQALARIAASNGICLTCHGPADERAFGHESLNDARTTHDRFPNALRHFSRVKCVTCHAPRGDGAAHDVTGADASLGDCEQCHVREDPAWASNYRSSDGDDRPEDHVYVVGSTRSWRLDRLSQLGFVGMLLLILAHSVRRRLGSEKWQHTHWLHVEGPRALKAWHSVQVALIAGLLITGLSMHYGDSGLAPVPFRLAVRTHNVLGIANVALWLLFVAVNGKTGHVRSYLSRLRSLPRELPAQLRYYAWDTFRGVPQPGPAQPGDRFNPLQKLAYASVMYVVTPAAVVSGSLLLYPLLAPERALGHPGLWPMAMVHLSTAYAMTLFVVVHVYMVGSAQDPTDHRPDAD